MRRPSPDARAAAILYRKPRAVIVFLLRKFWRDECPQRAASLAYTTILSLVPSLAVAFAMLKGFGGLKPLQARLESIVYTHLVTTSSLQAAEYIQKFTEKVHAGAIGSVGFLAFVLTAVSLLNTVGGAFNRVWGVAERRSLKERFLTFFALTILGPILFGASFSITGIIGQSSVWTWVPIRGLSPALGFTVPFLLTWAGFLLLYEVIPSVPLRFRPALVGSLCTAATWEVIKIGFEVYVSTMANYNKVYASLAVIPVFLLWLYVSWLIALLGFEFAFFLQHPEMLEASVEPAAAPEAVPVTDALRAFVHVAASFGRGDGPVMAHQIAERLGLSEKAAFALLAHLERLGYLARVAAPAEAYLPSRAPAGIRVVALWQALGGDMGDPHGDPLARLLASASNATLQAMGTTTIQDLVDAEAGRSPAGAGPPVREDLAEPA